MQIKTAAAMALILLSCNQAAKETAETTEAAKPKEAATTIDMHGYTANYSASFEMGDSKQSEAILALYRDWDDGKPDAHKEAFADTVELSFGDGNDLIIPRDSAMGIVSAWRQTYSAVKSSVHSVLPVKATGMDESWVCIWAKEVHTEKATNKTDSVELQENYRFDKNGKINWMLQYQKPAAPPKAKK